MYKALWSIARAIIIWFVFDLCWKLAKILGDLLIKFGVFSWNLLSKLTVEVLKTSRTVIADAIKK